MRKTDQSENVIELHCKDNCFFDNVDISNEQWRCVVILTTGASKCGTQSDELGDLGER